MNGNPVIGEFVTANLRSSKVALSKTSKIIRFAKTHTMVPGIVLGLTGLKIKASRPGDMPGVKAYSAEILADRFTLNIDSCLFSKLHGVGCTWLEIEADNVDFQYGSYSTEEDSSDRNSGLHYTRNITFQHAFSAAPKVVVWLRDIHNIVRGKIYMECLATDINPTGFKLHIEGWSDTRICTAAASWVAYPSDKPGIASGSFSTEDTRSWAQPQLYNSAFAAFPSGVFQEPPMPFVALKQLDIDC